MEDIEQALLHVAQRIRQDGARIHAFALVHQEGRNTQRADRLAKLLVEVIEVVIDKPVDRRIHRHIDLGVVQRGDTRQDDGRTIRLYGRTSIEIIDILEEDAYGDFLVRIIAGHIYADQGDILDLGMLFQHLQDVLFLGIRRDDIQQFVHCKTTF